MPEVADAKRMKFFGSEKETSSRDITTMDTTTVSEQPILITLEQAAQRLAISRRTLERLIAAGEFPSPLKLGRASRLAVEDIDIYCAQLRARRVSNHEVAYD
jgi:excisionase family DNA binding protein